MAKVALMTIGLLQAPFGDPQIQGFEDRVEANFIAAEAHPNFIGRSRFDEVTQTHTWGGRSNPRIFQDEKFNDRTAQTLSLWQDLESVFAFAYNGVHGEALSKRKEWFVRPQWPTYVAWWVRVKKTPSWEEAYERYDLLCREGSSPDAFDFKRPFDCEGQPAKIDRNAVKRHIINYR
ncbi:MAG: DUF3291 domain-containing protein [Chloroflexota bacterium]